MRAESRPLRVGVVVREYPVVSETFVADHVLGLVAQGQSVEVFCRLLGSAAPGKGAPVPRVWQSRDSRIERLLNVLGRVPAVPLRSLRHLLRGPYRSDLIPLAHQLRAAGSLDILHAHFGQLGEIVATLKQHLDLPTPLIVSVHGWDVNRALVGAAPRFDLALRTADRIVVSSRFMRRQTEALGCAPERIAQIAVGISLQDFAWSARRWQPPETLRLLTVARLVEQKGIDRGLRAVAALVQGGIRAEYSIIGDGPQREQLGKLAQELGIADAVRFRGALPRDQVIAEYAKHHLFLFPCTRVATGDEEGQGIALLEAQASGMPVLTTQHGGIPESVDGGCSGRIVADDTAAYVQGLRDLVANATQWTGMGEAGRDHVARHFEHSRHIRELLRLYDEVREQRAATAGALP